MPNVKPKTCHKCSRMYTGWRCPRCYRKSAKSAGGSRSASRRTFNASSVLSAAVYAESAPSGEYGDSRLCRHCGFLTTAHPCAYCGKE